MKEKLQLAAKVYHQIVVPDQYESLMIHTIKEAEKRKGEKKKMRLKKGSMVAAILFGGFVSTLNVSESFAQTITSIPIIGSVAQLFHFTHYEEQTESYELEVQVPQVHEEVEADYTKAVNEAIRIKVDEVMKEATEHAEERREAFIATGGEASDFRPVQIDIDYTVYYNKGGIVSFVIDHTEASANSYQKQYFYTLDLNNNQVITFTDLFDEADIEQINNVIKREMTQREMETGLKYFEEFDGIGEQPNFYINAYGKPVIVFEKYEIGPGAMGIQYFELDKIASKVNYPSQVSYEVVNEKEGEQANYPQIQGYKGELLEGYMNQSLYAVVEKYKQEGYNDLKLDYRINRIDDQVFSVTYRGAVDIEGVGTVPIFESMNLDMAVTGTEITVDNYIKADEQSQKKWQKLMNEKAMQKGLVGFDAEGVRMCFKDDRVVFYYMPLDDSAKAPIYITVPLEEMESMVVEAFEMRTYS